MEKQEEKPYRFKKSISKWGSSVGVRIPQVWFQFEENKDVKEVFVEVYSDKIVLIPVKDKKK